MLGNRSDRRRQKAKDGKAKKGKPSHDLSPVEKLFHDALDELAHVGGFSNSVSQTLAGLPTTMQGQLASMIHAKMCTHARSIGAICQSSMFDHSAIIALSRMLIEGWTFYHYLSEDILEEEWQLRYSVILLHDTTARITLVRAFQDKGEYADLTQGAKDLREKLQECALFQALSQDRQSKILSGQEIFVRGMRKAAYNSGWNEDQFNSIYSYYSAHTHSAPISIVRMAMHKVDVYAPGETQYAGAAGAICVASACLRRASLLALSDHSNLKDKFPKSYLEAAYLEDQSSSVFGKINISQG